ncbi:hypothetical protein CBL_04354 [Carabus blaptoides fortunei]
MKAILVTYLCVCLHLCYTQESEIPKCIETGDDLEKVCQYPKFEDDDELLRTTDEYKCYCDFSVDEGYQIEIIVEKLDLNGDKQDYILISTDVSPDKYKFSWHLNEQRRILLLGLNARLDFKTSDKQRGEQFSVRMKRFGVLTTTTTGPTPPMEWPSPGDNDRIFHLVNLTTTPHDVTNKNETFRNVIAKLAQEYCEKQEIPLHEDVTKDNVIIDLVITCPMSWPSYETCTQLRYAIPVVQVNGTDPAYQLQLKHLEKIWSIFVATELDKLGWTLYDVPDNNNKLLLWLGISLGVILVFCLFLLAVQKIGFILQNPDPRRLSDTKHIIDHQSRISDASLIPTTSQIVPSIFEDNAMAFFEPDLNTMNQSQVHMSSNNIIDIDESSDEEILTVSVQTSKHNSINLENSHDHESMIFNAMYVQWRHLQSNMQNTYHDG